MSRNYRANLGCGTLIILAIIVAWVSGAAVQNEIEGLESLVQELKQSVDAQTFEIQLLRSEIEGLRESQ